MVPSLISRILLQYFQGYRLFSIIFPLFSGKQYDVITDLICIIENVSISKTKNIFKKENAILVGFERPNFQISRDYFLCHVHVNPRLKEGKSSSCQTGSQ